MGHDARTPPFEIQFLDHVAIRVTDVEVSATWYEQILGLKRTEIPEWNNVPVFLLAGKTGIAIFPARLHDPKNHPHSKNVGIGHFAFNIKREDLEKAKEYLTRSGVTWEFQDHIYFHSIYVKDPDGHKVELTAVADEGSFYFPVIKNDGT